MKILNTIYTEYDVTFMHVTCHLVIILKIRVKLLTLFLNSIIAKKWYTKYVFILFNRRIKKILITSYIYFIEHMQPPPLFNI